MESFSTTLLIGAGVGGAIAWLLIAIYAFWRVGDARDEAKRYADRSRLLELALTSDDRRPIWVWEDGSISADDDTVAMLGLSGSVQTINDLSRDAASGIPPDTLRVLKSALASSRSLVDPVMVSIMNRPDILLDLEALSGEEEGWPIAILWIEELHPETMGAGVQGLERAVRALQKFIDALPYPVWQRDRDFRLVRVNQAYVDIVGAGSAEEVITLGKELNPARESAQNRQVAKEAMRKGDALKERISVVINNKKATLSVTTIPLTDQQSYVGVAVDVTGEEEALSELSRVVDAQTETLHRLRAPVAIFGPDQALRFYNDAFQRFSGLDEAWLAKEPLHSDLLDALRDNQRTPEDSSFRDWKNQILEQYTTLLEPREDIWYLADGSNHRVVTQPHPLGGLQVVFEDITDYLSLERSYNTLLAVQAETIDSLYEAVIVFGSDGLMKIHNPAFNELWRVDEERLQGKLHYNDIFDLAMDIRPNNPDWPIVREQFEEWFTTRKGQAGRFYNTDGPVVDYAVVPLSDGALMVRMIDMSASLERESSILARSEALEQADRLRSVFIGKMSHDLRTPLNTIVGFADLLKGSSEGDFSEQQLQYLRNISEASQDLSERISDLMDLAAMEAGTADLHLQPFKISALLDSTISKARERASDIGASITLTFDDKVNDVFGDRDRMHRVLDSLYLSLLNFSEDGTVIETSITAATNNMVEIRLTAYGTNTPAKVWAEVVRSVNEGTAGNMAQDISIHLSLLRAVVGLHNGHLRLDGTPKKGMIISCVLPREEIMEV